MILEQRTSPRSPVLVHILAVWMRPLFFGGVSAITFANVAVCGLGIHTPRNVTFEGLLSRSVGARMELVQCCCAW